MTDNNKAYQLTKYEKTYIDVFGRLYETTYGVPKSIGQIYALLAYKTKSPESGLNQQDIAALIDRSVSTVSRLLNKLVELKYCNYVEELNEQSRRERKYYQTNIKDLASNRFKFIISQNRLIQAELEKIKAEIPTEEVPENKEFIAHLEWLNKMFEQLNNIYKQAVILSQELLADL
ncbi:MAG: hypothetical protein ACFFCW_47545 [Candidatus Hodarchaeota archaeon]